MVRVLGLTGGLASGKSTVAAMLRDLGAAVIDADAVAREVTAPGTDVFREIEAAFGPEIVGADGGLDRARLAARIFADSSARARLNAITHPRIRGRLLEELDRFRRDPPPSGVIVLEVPLLLDTASREVFPLDAIIVVSVDRETQIARLTARDGLPRPEAEARLRAQRPLEEKVREADYVIDNTGDFDQTRSRIARLWAQIISATPS